jgi:metal-dependent amidase/aminoacylase/carboxypeptidase family protein
MLVCTVGEVQVWPGTSNVIPGSTQLSIDIRSKGDELRLKVVANVTAGIQELCVRRNVSCSVRRTHDAAAVLCDSDIIQARQAVGMGVRLAQWRQGIVELMQHDDGGGGGGCDDGACNV